MTLAKATSIGLGYPNIRMAGVPGHPGVQSKDTLQKNIREVTLAQVVENLRTLPAQAVVGGEPGAREIVCRGSFEEVNEYFLAHELSE